jgi:hypothetical protein
MMKTRRGEMACLYFIKKYNLYRFLQKKNKKSRSGSDFMGFQKIAKTGTWIGLPAPSAAQRPLKRTLLGYPDQEPKK